MSTLVIQEVENLREREATELAKEVKRTLKRIKKFDSAAPEPVKLLESLIRPYALRAALKTRVENLEEIAYEGIPQSVVVERALKRVRPFQAGEKGYRDTLIWMSLLEYLKQTDAEGEVAFITANSSDFFKISKNEVAFHKDLLQDIRDRDLKARLVPYTNLWSFLKQNVHEVGTHCREWELPDPDQICDGILEEILEDEGTLHLGHALSDDLASHLGVSLFSSHIKEVLDVRVEVQEGIEDLELIYAQAIGDDQLYIPCSFNLRRVSVEIDISEADYVLHQEIVDQLFYVDRRGEIVTLEGTWRAYFDASFVVNMELEGLKDFEVMNLGFRG